MKHLLWALPLFVGLVAAPTAQADIWDDIQFVREVNEAGIQYDTRENLIDMGHAACDALTLETTSYEDLIRAMTEVGGASVKSANIIGSLAVEHICPDQWPKVVVAQIALPQEARILI